MTPESFKTLYLSTAEEVQRALGFNRPDVFLAQWADETAWGESPLAVNHHNLAGINYNGVACTNWQGFGSYASLAQFVMGYLSTIRLNGWGYPEFLATKDGTFEEQAHALGASSWAASHYRADGSTVDGSTLLGFARDMGLDQVAPTPAPPPDPSPVHVTRSAPYSYTYIDFRADASGLPGVEAISKDAWGVDNVGEVLRWAGLADAVDYHAGDPVAIPGQAEAPVVVHPTA